MKKVLFILAVALTSISCQKEDPKPVKTFWAAIRFKVGTVYKWSHNDGVKQITLKVDGKTDFVNNIEDAPGYPESECNAFSYGYMIQTREEKKELCFMVIGDRGEILAEGVLVFKDPKEDIRI
jgi:hypothetical protein